MRTALFALLLGAAAPHPNPAVQAERDFAAAVAEQGVKRGFLAFAAPGAFMFAPSRKSVPEVFADTPERVESPPLAWWPEFAGMARSGEFGFTTGSASVPTRYFTVWRQQPDGSWKWIYDGGVPLSAPMPAPGDRPVLELPPADAAAGSAAQALAEIAPLEAALARATAADARAALRPYLLPQALVGGSPRATWPGAAGQSEGLAQRPSAMTLSPSGGEASAAGDLAFTCGEAAWQQGETARRGHYLRIWQKRREGWRLAVDLLLPEPPPRMASPD